MNLHLQLQGTWDLTLTYVRICQSASLTYGCVGEQYLFMNFASQVEGSWIQF